MIWLALFMCSSQDSFITYEEVSKSVVMIDNNIPCRIVVIGMIRLKFFDRNVRTLDVVNVFLI